MFHTNHYSNNIVLEPLACTFTSIGLFGEDAGEYGRAAVPANMGA